MQRSWLKHYGANVPETIDPDSYDSVVDMMLEACEQYGDRMAFSNFGTSKTYAEVESLSRDFGAYLQQSLGIRHGDRVALMLPNMLAFPVAMLGILRVGAVQVNVNPLYTPRELEHQLVDADTDTIVVFAGSTATLETAIEATPIKNVIVVGLDDLIDAGLQSPPVDDRLAETIDFIDTLDQGKELDITPVTIRGDDLIYLQYTGGTTGISKGAMLSHRNLVANILQFDAFGGDVILPGKEIIVTAIPMYHIFALM
ncbi:MAG: AMP-binding protein, partial [Gammaproteobacteria bacterium]|nr:AMP-binding protein [Gammaproteobacteria bacterium]